MINPEKFYKVSELCLEDPFYEAKHWHWVLKQIRDGNLEAVNVTKDQRNKETGRLKVPSYLIKGQTAIEFSNLFKKCG